MVRLESIPVRGFNNKLDGYESPNQRFPDGQMLQNIWVYPYLKNPVVTLWLKVDYLYYLILSLASNRLFLPHFLEKQMGKVKPEGFGPQPDTSSGFSLLQGRLYPAINFLDLLFINILAHLKIYPQALDSFRRFC